MSTTAQPFATYIHPQALCEGEVGPGSRVWAFAHVLRGARVGRDCNIGDHAFIENGAVVGDRVTIKNQVMIWDGVTIEDDVFLGPGVIFTNDRFPRSGRMAQAMRRYEHKENWLETTHVCRGASIGAGAIVVCGVTIGAFATIGAGALVTRDVPAHALMLGRPATQAGWMCECGLRLDDQFTCVGCGRQIALQNANHQA